MDTRQTELEEPLAETPEDVAILYSWANLHGAKYRDFSASRREYRAQVRHRAAEEARVAELEAKDQAEAAATEAEQMARDAERAARSSDAYDDGFERERALREADDASRRAAAERVEVARRAEAAAHAEAAARREEREIAEAHASAERQAARWQDSDLRRRALAGPQPIPPGLTADPYEHPEYPNGFVAEQQHSPNRALEYTHPARFRVDSAEYAPRISGERRAYRERLEVFRRPQGYHPDLASGVREAYRAPEQARPAMYPAANQAAYPDRQAAEYRVDPRNPSGYPAVARPAQPAYARPERELRYDFGQGTDGGRGPVRAADRVQGDAQERAQERTSDRMPDRVPARVPERMLDRAYEGAPQSRQLGQAYPGDESRLAGTAPAPSAPAWLYGGSNLPPASVETPTADTLQYSRERVAARWFALKGVFEPGTQKRPSEPLSTPAPDRRIPVLAVFSLAGGVGKTSMLATLARSLSSVGERVLLADTTSHGLLPYYFGASELRPGVVRTFSPPAGSTDAPIHLVSYDLAGADREQRPAQGMLAEEIVRHAAGTQRILLDLNGNSGWLTQRLARMNPTVLVPVAPDMNSVISLQAVEKYFQAVAEGEGRALVPFYVLNQFDASLPLHLDVREVLRRQLGDRLLPFAVRRAPAVSEALAEGMTVVDYAPESGVAEDYRNVANWLRSLAAPANQAFRNTRWSER